MKRGPGAESREQERSHECVAKMAEFYRNQNLGEGRETQGLEMFRVGWAVYRMTLWQVLVSRE